MRPMLALTPLLAIVLTGCFHSDDEEVPTTAVREVRTYEVTFANQITDASLGPVLLAPTTYDDRIYDGDYVTPEAEILALTGNPEPLATAIGLDAAVHRGSSGESGDLIGPGERIQFEIASKDRALIVIAKAAPGVREDNLVIGIVELAEFASVALDIFDVGANEERRTVEKSGLSAALVTARRKN